jgi:putative ABC transport system permease protein
MRTVDSIAFTNAWPLQQSQLRDVGTGGAASFQTRAGIVGVSPDYFTALSISIQAGRAFNGGDRMGSAPVAIVSRTLASRIWRNDNPIGQSLVMSPAGGAPATARPATFTVIGVASDIRHTHTDDDLADAYVPLLQSPSPAVFAYLRVSGNEATAERELQQLLASVDPDVGFAMVRPLADILDEQRAGARLLATLLVVFAAFAAALALVGMYGVIAYTVKQREREIAVRMAIGADRQTIARLFLRQGAMVLALGLVVGVGGSLALGRVLQTQLFNVPATDPLMIAGAAAAFALCGFAAIAWPARAAASLDPAQVLKES